ncbi:hypothetical protein ACWE42_20085 [Sutcliffiella cohnii]
MQRPVKSQQRSPHGATKRKIGATPPKIGATPSETGAIIIQKSATQPPWCNEA